MNSLQLGLLFFMALKHSRFCTFRPQLFNCSLCQTPVTDSSPAATHCLTWSMGPTWWHPRLGQSGGRTLLWSCSAGAARAPWLLQSSTVCFPPRPDVLGGPWFAPTDKAGELSDSVGQWLGLCSTGSPETTGDAKLWLWRRVKLYAWT